MDLKQPWRSSGSNRELDCTAHRHALPFKTSKVVGNGQVEFRTIFELLEASLLYHTIQDITILYRNCSTSRAIMASSTEQQSRKSPASRSPGPISLMQYSLEELRRRVPFLYDVSSRTTTASCNFCAKPEQCKFPLALLGSSQSDLQRDSCRWQTILDVVFCMSNCPVLREYLSSAHVRPLLNQSCLPVRGMPKGQLSKPQASLPNRYR